MKVVIIIPVYNEEENLGCVLDDIKTLRTLKGFFPFRVVIVNDGSTDRSLEVAKSHGIGDIEILDLKRHLGLGVAYKAGIKYALESGADIVVVTDADFQYQAKDIPKLLSPILEGRADFVIGDRQIGKIPGYPRYKFFSQSLGNFIISALFQTQIKDATSGFRAYNRLCLELLAEKLSNPYTYIVESLCFLLKYGKRVFFVPVYINYPTRPSRLIRSKLYYCFNFLVSALRVLLMKKD